MYNHLVLFGNSKESSQTETEESDKEGGCLAFSVKLEAEEKSKSVPAQYANA